MTKVAYPVFGWPQQIDTSASGFDALARLHAAIGQSKDDSLELDLRALDWIDANLCAAVGAMIRKRKSGKVIIRCKPEVEAILHKNGFYQSRYPDTWNTTIRYGRFPSDGVDDFRTYLNAQFAQRLWPEMSQPIHKAVRQSLGELFTNASDHANSAAGVFACGQYYYRKQRLVFTVADAGVGIRKNVADFTREVISAEEAIQWALESNNTTRRGDIPGGLGLKLLREFLSRNGGRLIIASDAGYWQLSPAGIFVTSLSEPFPGTVVSIDVLTAQADSAAVFTEHSDFDENVF